MARASILSLALCSLLAFASAAEEPPAAALKIAVADPICRQSACSCVTGVLREYAETVKLLEARSGLKLELVYFEEETLLQNELMEGAFDGVVGKLSVFGGTIRDSKRDFVRIADISKPDGDALLRGVFIVYKGSEAKDLASTKGLRFAFGTEDSPEKSQLAFETLKKLGIDVPDKDSRLEFFSCKEAALALIEKRADVAVISDYAMQFGCIVVVGDPKDFRVIGMTDGVIPFTTFMLDKAKVRPEIVERLSKALLSVKGGSVPEELLSKGFVEPQPWPSAVKLP